MGNMKWSRYNFIIDNDDRKLLYNSYTNGLHQLDHSIWNDLSKTAHNGVLNHFSEEEREWLKANMILVQDDETLINIMHHQSMQRIFDKTHMILTIAPTQNCNFNCSYCYEKFRAQGRMNTSTEDAIVNYIKKRIDQDGVDTIDLTWYGGEPLLESRRLLSLGTKIKKLPIKITNNEIITNGYLLNKNNLLVLDEIGVELVQVTLDGFEDIHNSRRHLLNGHGTFSRIIKNLDNHFSGDLKERFIVGIRVNIDKTNQNYFLDFQQWLRDRYNSEKLVIQPGWVHLDDENALKCNCYNNLEATNFCINAFKNTGVSFERMYPEDVNIECLARNPYSMVIGWQGEIYKCYEDLGNKSLVVGNVNNNPVWNNIDLISKYSVGIDHYFDSECRECSYLPICHGGCPKRRYENKFEGKMNDCCTPFKNRLKDYLSVILRKNVID